MAERERRLTGEILAVYVEALAAMRELEITEGPTDIDTKTVVSFMRAWTRANPRPSS